MRPLPSLCLFLSRAWSFTPPTLTEPRVPVSGLLAFLLLAHVWFHPFTSSHTFSLVCFKPVFLPLLNVIFLLLLFFLLLLEGGAGRRRQDGVHVAVLLQRPLGERQYTRQSGPARWLYINDEKKERKKEERKKNERRQHSKASESMLPPLARSSSSPFLLHLFKERKKERKKEKTYRFWVWKAINDTKLEKHTEPPCNCTQPGCPL